VGDKELLDNYLKNTKNARRCPNSKCDQPVVKESGCNRVECLACKFHICWKCDAFYKDYN